MNVRNAELLKLIVSATNASYIWYEYGLPHADIFTFKLWSLSSLLGRESTQLWSNKSNTACAETHGMMIFGSTINGDPSETVSRFAKEYMTRGQSQYGLEHGLLHAV